MHPMHGIFSRVLDFSFIYTCNTSLFDLSFSWVLDQKPIKKKKPKIMFIKTRVATKTPRSLLINWIQDCYSSTRDMGCVR